MKKLTTRIAIAAIFLSLFSCGNKKGENNNAKQDTLKTEEKISTQTSSSTFSIDAIPFSDKSIGNFPFFNMPEGLVSQNKPIEKKYDQIFFPIGGVMTPFEGKAWKANVVVKEGSSEQWSLPYFQKSFEEAILSAGGVKIFDGEITNEEYEKYSKQATNLGEDGGMGYADENIKVYVIRRKDQGNIYIQLTGNTAYGKINILQEEGFKRTITLIKSDEIKKQLDEKGKAVLHINFDTDKASLKPDGSDAVKEIVKVLNTDKALKIAINGYTDNSGNEEHNLKLSEARAQSVKDEIVKAGIAVDRLSAKGFGQQNPIADNTTEEGKAQNRRVELIKK
ncbi:flagellar motor protein MotB [Sphingobacterium sp. Ag1]|uniref:OmpA family protein n=1 Tax=Sphingobacterium sp. Ag1 TaxID=1643451 RepID=UPI0006277800|nr:OmpA family protein [Sphingobacterium sp. Ag1]KKO89134.1 flagellar motor protein MotB [Sphingobacterium sp. Ag1]